MEFEEMKKIWDKQNNEPLYAINEAALHRGIRAKRKDASWASSLTEISLMFLAIAVGGFLFVKSIGDDNAYDLPPAIIMILTGLYVLVGRLRRKKIEKQYDQSMIGELDQAIANMDFEITRSRTFVWWYILPIASATTLNMIMNQASIEKWLLVGGLFVLGFVVIRWGLTCVQIPQKRKLERLRDKLTIEMERDVAV